MYIGFYNYHTSYNRNVMLTQPKTAIGDNLNWPFVLLAQKLKAQGHRVATIDTDNLKNFDVVVFVEFPGSNNHYLKKLVADGAKNLYVLLLESPAIKPDNYVLENHRYFKKIFTWQDDLVDHIKYFKVNYSHHIPVTLDGNPSQKEKEFVLIASNKSGWHRKELYSERKKAIRWFEDHHPEDFDLYGKGWDRHNFEGKLLGFKLAHLNRLTLLTKLLQPRYPSYQGSIASKHETYKKYRFSICYENVTGYNGYVTEKIFDCFLADCVPIYLGAPNVTDHIPKETFIDKRQFDTYEKLYDYTKNMPNIQYLGYLDAIHRFLSSNQAIPFSAEYFADTIIQEITS